MVFMFYKKLTTTTDEKEMLAILDDNHKTSLQIFKAIEELKSIDLQEKPQKKPSISLDATTSSTDSVPRNNRFEDEVEFFMSSLQMIPDSVSTEELAHLLPSRQNANYKALLLRLKLELQKNIREIKEILEEGTQGFTAQDLYHFKQDLLFERRKVEVIDQQLFTEVKEDSPVYNKLIFVPTSGGSIRVLKQLKSIPSEYYSSFQSLLQSIKDGTFKNAKRFSNAHNKLSGMSEVRDIGAGTRVIFDRLDTNSYAIITAFVKKTDHNKGYLEQLERSVGNYKSLKPVLETSLNNPLFQQENEMLEQTIYDVLEHQEKGDEDTCQKKLLLKSNKNKV